jgi:hypothetical protein
MSGRTRLPEICAKSLRGFSSVSAKSRWDFPEWSCANRYGFLVSSKHDKLYVILRNDDAPNKKIRCGYGVTLDRYVDEGVPTRLQDGAGGDRLEAPGIALSFWQVAGLVKVQEPGGGGREARGGRGLGHVTGIPRGKYIGRRLGEPSHG